MAQALIQPAVANVQAAGTAPLVDPAMIREARRRLLRDDIPELEYANSFYAPSGRWPARGWILVPRSNYVPGASPLKTGQLNIYATNLELQIDDFVSGTLTFKNLAIVQARCVTTGIAADPDSIYLMELTDARGVLSNPWAQWPTTSQYNVRAPAYPGQFYSLTTNAGTPWTWSTMVGDLWGQMPLLGPYPGLGGSPPTDTPENFSFPGMSAWEALFRILDLLGATVTYNPTLANPYGISAIGAADAVLSALLLKYQQPSPQFPSGKLQEDLQWIDGGSGRVPGSLTVLFHKRYEYYGTEETVRMDGLQAQTDEMFPVTVAAPAPFNASAGEDFIWDTFTVRVDIDGNPLAADVTQANALAVFIAQDYFNRIFRGTLGYLKQVYAGALPFYAGSVLDGVCWRQQRKERQSWQTEVIRGPQPPWPVVDRKWT